MGSIYRAVCPHCTYKKEFPVGGGLNSCNLNLCVRLLRPVEQERIRKLKEHNQIKRFTIENHITECRFCGELKSQMIISIEDNRDKLYTFGNLCENCDQEVTVYPNTLPYRILCPECKTDALDISEVGLWD